MTMSNSQDQNGSKHNGITTKPLPATQKVFVHSPRQPAIGVAMRAVTLSGAHNGHASNGNGGGHAAPTLGDGYTTHASNSGGGVAMLTERIRIARLKGYEGDPCTDCGQLTMVRNGACLKCDSCGGTSGCS